jgi:tetratricopeptide (TPR) repeat protein
MRYIFFLILIFTCISCKYFENKESLELALKSDTLILKGEFNDALLAVEKSIELDNDNYIAFNNLGYIRRELNYPDSEVLFAINKAHELNEEYPIAIANLVIFYFDKENYSEAIKWGMKYLNNAEKINLNPIDKSQILGKIGESYNYLKSYEKADSFLTKSIEIDSTKATWYKERGTANRNLHKNKEALNDYNRAIELDSLYSQAYNSRAIYFDDLNIIEKAFSDYNMAIKLKPSSSIYLMNRAKLFIKIGKIEEACKDIIKSDSIGHEEANEYYEKYCKEK